MISINAHLIKRNEVFLNEIKTCPYIISAAGSYGGISSLFGFPEIKISVLSKPNEIKTIKCMNVWGDYFKTAEIQFIAGRDFITGSDSKSLILNETAIKILGITNPLGEYVLLNNVSYKIIGVVKDFNMYSSYTQIPALVFKNDKTISNILIRANSENTQKVIDFVEKKWDEIYDEYSGRFHYIFPEQSALDYYSSEQNFGKTIQTFAILSIIIASLGLFGLSTFLAKQKTKEIGIRKIFGSSVYSIIKTISKDFFILTIIANLMAWPLSWYLMSLWLQNFAYTINMPLEIFIITALSTLIFVMVILFINTYKTAYLNPINAIKYE